MEDAAEEVKEDDERDLLINGKDRVEEEVVRSFNGGGCADDLTRLLLSDNDEV